MKGDEVGSVGVDSTVGLLEGVLRSNLGVR